MKKIYIAGKIGGLLPAVYEANFKEAKEYLRRKGCMVLSPIDFPHNHDKTWSSYMKEDLGYMLQCDYVFALNNWQDSPGATIEIELAIKLGLEIIYQPSITPVNV